MKEHTNEEPDHPIDSSGAFQSYDETLKQRVAEIEKSLIDLNARIESLLK